MKRFVFILSALFICTFAFARTIRWHVGDAVIRTDTCSSGDSITPPTAPAKTGYNFARWDVLYTQVEYLQASGNQWINTEYKPNSLTGIKTKMQFDSIENNLSISFQAAQTDTSRFASFIWNKKLYFFYGTIKHITSYAIQANDVVEMDWDKNNIVYSVNGVRKPDVSLSEQTFSYNQPIYMFASNYLGREVTGERYGKIYYFQIYDNDILVHDFIPVLDKNGTPCMYDKVTKIFFYNQGTGDFIAGPAI